MTAGYALLMPESDGTQLRDLGEMTKGEVYLLGDRVSPEGYKFTTHHSSLIAIRSLSIPSCAPLHSGF